MASRQLAAIMFTDIVGYTALMDQDEQKAFELLSKNRKLQKPIIEKYHGKWLKEIGDGVLASFSTISDSVNCAIEIQEICANDPDLNLRIGIHQGEVVFEGEDVFGSGVNIASRLESLAPIGGILISEAVYNNVANKGIKSTFLGEKQLKNVANPIRTYQVTLEETRSVTGPEISSSKDTSSIRPEHTNYKPSDRKKIVWSILTVLLLAVFGYIVYNKLAEPEVENLNETESAQKPLTIAVLPFENESSDKENEYFINGMTEDIRNNLSKISDLRVISKTSSEKYRSTVLSSTQIGQELGVTYILEGTAQKIGSQVKIHAQMIKTETDDHFWSESYVREITDVFKVQSEIAKEVANQLEITLSSNNILNIEQAPTNNMAAYDFYLKGKQSLSEWSLNREIVKIEDAISQFIKAEKEDPLFVWPIVARAGIYSMASSNEITQRFSLFSLDSVLILCNRALAINPNYASAYITRSSYYAAIDENEKSFLDKQKAWKLEPNAIENLFSYANEHFNAQNYIEGLQVYHKALRLSPGGDMWALHGLGFKYLELGDVDQAIYYWDQMALSEPVAFDLHTRAQLYSALKQWDTSYDLIQKAKSLDLNDAREGLEALGLYHTQKREFEKALGYFKEAEKLPSQDYVATDLQAKLYYGIALYLSGAEEDGESMLRDCLASYLDTSPSVFDNEAYIAGIYTFLGNKEEAYNWLRKSNWKGWSLISPEQGVLFTMINGEKEFQDIVSSVKEERKEIREEIARLKAASEWEI